jgi:hypothetical protein
MQSVIHVRRIPNRISEKVKPDFGKIAHYVSRGDCGELQCAQPSADGVGRSLQERIVPQPFALLCRKARRRPIRL